MLGKGNKPKKERIVERLIQAVTYTGVAVQYTSVIFSGFARSIAYGLPLWIIGFALTWLGAAFFIAAVFRMKDNWRAGFTEDQNTMLVTSGIYRVSRNPAFTGFDLLYIGCTLAYPNVATIIWSIAAILFFHLQILGEEKYLASAFSLEYDVYKKRVCRYFGKRSK